MFNSKRPLDDPIEYSMHPHKKSCNTPSFPHFNLGNEVYVRVQFFRGNTRIDIRKYLKDVSGAFQPTKEGISILPNAWNGVHKQLPTFASGRTKPGTVSVIEKDICLSKHQDGASSVVWFQKMFQRKDSSLDFDPCRISLHSTQMDKLCNFSTEISDCIVTSLVRHTVQNIVLKELMKTTTSYTECRGDPDNPDGLDLLTSAFYKCMYNFIFSRISELFACYGCAGKCLFDSVHDCSRADASDVFEEFFNSAMLTLNWSEISSCFIRDNANSENFINLVYDCDFFECLDVKEMIKYVKELFIENFGKNVS